MISEQTISSVAQKAGVSEDEARRALNAAVLFLRLRREMRGFLKSLEKPDEPPADGDTLGIHVSDTIITKDVVGGS